MKIKVSQNKEISGGEKSENGEGVSAQFVEKKQIGGA